MLTGGHAEIERTIGKYKSQSDCDVVLRACCGTTLKAHRIVLQGKSDYFEALYGAAGKYWSDSGDSVDFGQISASSLGGCLDWIYLGSASVVGSIELHALVDAAIYLQIETLVTAAVKAIVEGIDTSNAIGSWEIARRHSLVPAVAGSNLEAAAVAAASNGFEVIARGEAWSEAPVALVEVLLADDRLGVASEEQAYGALISWLRARSPPLAAANALALLSRIRFARMPREFVDEVVCREPLLTSEQGRDLLFAAFQQYAYERTRPGRMTPRAGYRGRYLFVIGGTGGSTHPAVDTVERYDTINAEWQMMPSMPSRRSSCAVAAVGDGIYVVGGLGGSKNELKNVLVDSVDRFMPKLGRWETVPPMRVKRSSGCSAVALDGHLYVLGGRDCGRSSRPSASVERFCPASGAWTTITPMAQPRFSHAAAVLDGKLYVAGGFDLEPNSIERVQLSSVERYDPLTVSWSTVASMRHPRDGCQLVALDGKLLVVFGTGPMQPMERYDPKANAWEEVAYRPAIWRSAVAVLGERVCVLGGSSRHVEGAVNSVIAVCPTTGDHMELPPMAVKRQWAGCVPF